MENTQSDCHIRHADLPWEEMGDGIRRKILGYDAGLMLVRVLFEEDSVGAIHQHRHRQVSYVESGAFAVEIDGETKTLRAGDSFFVPADTPHGAVCLEKGCLIDVFCPAREDFLNG